MDTLKFMSIMFGGILIGAGATYGREDFGHALMYLLIAICGMILLMYGTGL